MRPTDKVSQASYYGSDVGMSVSALWERSLTFCSRREPEYLVTVLYRSLPKVSAQSFTLQDRKAYVCILIMVRRQMLKGRILGREPEGVGNTSEPPAWLVDHS